MTYRYPQTREEYRQQVIQKASELLALMHLDPFGSDDLTSRAEGLARGLDSDVREALSVRRWQPNPVLDGVRDRVPLDAPVTITVTYPPYDEGGAARVNVYRGKVGRIYGYNERRGALYFRYVPKGGRNPREIRADTGYGTLTIREGYGEGGRVLWSNE